LWHLTGSWIDRGPVSAALAGEAALTEYLREAATWLATIKAAELAPALGDLVPDVDIAALNGVYGDYMAESYRVSVSAGIDGWRDDDLAFVHDWGMPLDIGVPVSIWLGDEDRMVPRSHGEWLARHIPGSRLHRRPSEGHMSLFVNELDTIVADPGGIAHAADRCTALGGSPSWPVELGRK
jgi:pimeloyl-ACP methyl ester carboxylesterase